MDGGGGKTYMKLGGGGGKAYMKLKRYERGVFDSFSRRGLLYMKLTGGGASNILSPKMMSHTASVRFQLLGP